MTRLDEIDAAVKQESEADAMFRRFIAENREALKPIAQWGDGKCWHLIEIPLDHIIPESKQGETTVENLQVLCKPCNSSKGARLEPSGCGGAHV